jgi:predicted nucleic acid-binding protein
MLYSINQIQSKLAKNSAYREQKNDIMKFFHVNNIFNDLKITTVYTSSDHPPLFLEQKDIEKICQMAQHIFGMPFDYQSFYSGEKPLATVENNLPGIQSYQVKNVEDVNQVIEDHYQTSNYGLKQQQQEKLNQEKKDREALALEKHIQDKKKKEWEAFNKASNLKRDFETPKIVSIDFEFFLKKKDNVQTHTVTEMGITTNENGQINSQHYLVEETYQLKKNKNLQNSFHFGETKIVKLSEIVPILNKALENSKYVLFHEQREDYEILQTLNVQIDSTIDVIDTQLSYKHYFKEKDGLNNGKPLEDLLDKFKVEYKDLHNAGNDAYYTLVLLKEMQKSLVKKQEASLSVNTDKRKNKM